MKIMKYFLIVTLLLCLCQTGFGEKRANPTPMKELTDPASPSYVPYPYPKTKKEVAEDLKYAINKVFTRNQESYVDGETPDIKEILLKVIDESSGYTVSDVVKVKNRNHRMAHDYSWLIMIRDENGDIVARTAMRAEGLISAAMGTAQSAKLMESDNSSSRRGPQFLETKDEVIDKLADAIGRPFSKKEIKSAERVAFPSPLGFMLAPMWEIKLQDGSSYYYSVKRDTIYELEEKIPWGKDKNGKHLYIRDVVPHAKDFVPDTVNDEVLVLKALKKET